jgi:hypothetical protein
MSTKDIYLVYRYKMKMRDDIPPNWEHGRDGSHDVN